jgi:ribose-phosphate pyrophosphokinase
VKRAEVVRQALERRFDRSVELAFVEKFRSEGEVWGGTVVGTVADRVAIILDDLISSGTTLVGAATACREQGADAVCAAVTHGLFSTDAGRTLAASDLERLFILDTVPPARLDAAARRKVDVIDCAPLLATTIYRLHTERSLAEWAEG